MDIQSVLDLVRSDIKLMTAYSSARSLHSDEDSSAQKTLFLDANEAPVEPFPGGTHLNRYDSQQPPALLNKIAELNKVEPENLMLTRGSDEAIDVIIRTFCNPGTEDTILQTSPTFGMYAQYAALSAVKVTNVPLDPYSFDIDKDGVLHQLQPNSSVKAAFICSPNNPTGTAIPMKDLIDIIQKSDKIVVVDEAYIEYHDEQKLLQLLPFNPQLIILRTLSKARALAGVRLGYAIGHKDVIKMLRKVLPPYPMTRPVIDTVLRALEPQYQDHMQDIRSTTIGERERIGLALRANPDIEKVWPSATNFLLVKVADPDRMMKLAEDNGIILRNMSHQIPRAIRITLGLPEDNNRLLSAWGIEVQG